MKHGTRVLAAASIVAFGAAAQACSGGAGGATSSTEGASASSSGAGTGGGSMGTGSGGDTTASSAGTGGIGGAGGSAPAACNGYEPCGVNVVVVPAGYKLASSPGISVTNSNTQTSCTAFADCDMWDTHFTPIWTNVADNGYNRMGSPFPWPLSRYVVIAPSKTITYVKLHMTAPGEAYVYGDGTHETHTDETTGVTTCFARGPGHLLTGGLGNMGGTGNAGVVAWNIGVLPGDMGNSGNASTCNGTGATTNLPITSDEATAATKDSLGKYRYCLLREGQDYYVSFMSSGKIYAVDCSTQDCTIGGFAFSNPTTSDGSAFLVEVPCN